MTNALSRFGNPEVINDSLMNAVSEANHSDNNLATPKKDEKSRIRHVARKLQF